MREHTSNSFRPNYPYPFVSVSALLFNNQSLFHRHLSVVRGSRRRKFEYIRSFRGLAFKALRGFVFNPPDTTGADPELVTGFAEKDNMTFSEVSSRFKPSSAGAWMWFHCHLPPLVRCTGDLFTNELSLSLLIRNCRTILV